MEDIIANDDPTYRTYHSIDWKDARQAPSETRCVACGAPMLKLDPIRNKAGASYEGLVCHECKVVFWLKG